MSQSANPDIGHIDIPPPKSEGDRSTPFQNGDEFCNIAASAAVTALKEAPDGFFTSMGIISGAPLEGEILEKIHETLSSSDATAELAELGLEQICSEIVVPAAEIFETYPDELTEAVFGSLIDSTLGSISGDDDLNVADSFNSSSDISMDNAHSDPGLGSYSVDGSNDFGSSGGFDDYWHSDGGFSGQDTYGDFGPWTGGGGGFSGGGASGDWNDGSGNSDKDRNTGWDAGDAWP